MKKTILLSVFILLSFSALFAQDDQEIEKELIKKVIQTAYVDGLCNNADEAAINKGIHSGFQMVYSRGGNTLWKLPIYNWIEMAKDGKEKGNKYSFQNEYTTVKFLFIDISGNVAIAKIEFYEGKELNYIDYLSLMKFEDGWKIVGKMFHRIPKEKKEE